MSHQTYHQKGTNGVSLVAPCESSAFPISLKLMTVNLATNVYPPMVEKEIKCGLI